MLLGAWRRAWLAYDFDRDRGLFRRRLVRMGEHLPVCGFAAIERTREHGRVFFSLHRYADRIVFQANQRRFTLDTPGLRFGFEVHPGGGSSTFTVHEAGTPVFTCSYRHWLRATKARLARQREGLDFEGDHFLFHVASLTLPFADPAVWEDAAAPPITDDDSVALEDEQPPR